MVLLGNPLPRSATDADGWAAFKFTAAYNPARITPTPGIATITAFVRQLNEPLVSLFITVVGPPAILVVAASPTSIVCGEVATVTITVRDAIGQDVLDQTPVELFTNAGGALAPPRPLTYGGVAVSFLLTSRIHEGPYAVVARVGSMAAAPPIAAQVGILATRRHSAENLGRSAPEQATPKGNDPAHRPATSATIGDLPEEIDVAISYAGPDREHADRLVEILAEHRFSYFYDQDYLSFLWGKVAPPIFDHIYGKAARYVVVFVSQDYLDRNYTFHELQAALSKFVAQHGKDYILPIQVSGKRLKLEGLPDTVLDLSLTEHGIDKIGQMLIEKLTAAGVKPAERGERPSL